MVNDQLKNLEKEMEMVEKLYEMSKKIICLEVSCSECPFNMGSKTLPSPGVHDGKTSCGEVWMYIMLRELLNNCRNQ